MGKYRIALIVVIAVLIVIAAFVLLSTPSTPHAATQESFSLVVEDGKVVSGNPDIVVHQGDTVTLSVTNDAAEELHLHGYNIMVDLATDTPGTITFTATSSGRFSFELEHEKIELGAVSVLPQ